MLYHLRVKAGQRKETLHISGERILLSIKEKPKGGAANRRVIELLSLHFGIPAKYIRIVRGHHAPSKLVEVSR